MVETALHLMENSPMSPILWLNLLLLVIK